MQVTSEVDCWSPTRTETAVGSAPRGCQGSLGPFRVLSGTFQGIPLREKLEFKNTLKSKRQQLRTRGGFLNLKSKLHLSFTGVPHAVRGILYHPRSDWSGPNGHPIGSLINSITAPTAVGGEKAGDGPRFAPVRELARTGQAPQPLRPPGLRGPAGAGRGARRAAAAAPRRRDASSPPPVVPRASCRRRTGARRRRARATRRAPRRGLPPGAPRGGRGTRAAAWKDAATDAETVASMLAAALREEWKDRAPAKWAALRDDFATFRARYARHVAAAAACLPPQPLGEASNLGRD